MKNTIHIVLTGGGTGGHLFPGLAVARQLTSELRQARVTLVGSGKPLERQLATAAGFEHFALPCRPLPRRALDTVSFVLENLAGYMAAGRFLVEEQVDAVVGLGGYASVPMGRAAARRGVPLVLLEQNAVLGRANRWLSRWANLICTSFEQTEKLVHPRCPVRMTGNPIRFDAEQFARVTDHGDCPDFRGKASENGTVPFGRDRDKQILVLGGSGGARSLNENVPRALYKLRDSLAGWQVIHQSGEADLEATRDLYRKLAIEATVEAFLGDLPEVMAATSLAVCRAGGTTLAELSALGVPAVLLPYPHAADDHQRKNADVYATSGGAVLVDERELPGRLDDQLATVISAILDDADRRAAMSAAMRSLATPGAAASVASLVWSLVSSRARREPLPVAA